MDKVFLYIFVAQETINIIFNSYQKYPKFEMDDRTILHFVHYFDSVLENVEKSLVEYKLFPQDLFPDAVAGVR